MFELRPEMQEKIIIGIFIGFILTIVAYYFRKKIIGYKEFLGASKEFKEAFHETKNYLNEANDFKDSYTSEDFASAHIEANIAKHEIAYKKFLPYLGWFNTIRINRVWQQYAYPDYKKFSKDWNVKERFEYMEGPDWIKQAEIRKLLRKRINKLLKFAKVR